MLKSLGEQPISSKNTAKLSSFGYHKVKGDPKENVRIHRRSIQDMPKTAKHIKSNHCQQRVGNY
jgi:hypothetical protein